MTKFKCFVSILLVGFAVSINAQQSVPTAITYQGSLEQAGQPANGSYDLSFQLYDGPDSGSGTPVGSSVVTEDVSVVDGLFTVQLDFGTGAFDGEARWLEIGVRDGASTGAFTLLSPFSPVTPAPQARYAVNAGQLGGMNTGDFALAGHAHAALSAGDGLAGANYDGTGAAAFSVGAGDGIAVSADEVAARVDGTSIDFNTSGELAVLPQGPGYGEVATVAKSGGDYTDPVAAMNDRTNWCSETVICLLRIMPGIYNLNTALELHPLVNVVGVGNQLGQTVGLLRNDTGSASGVVDASACGPNGCRMGNLTIATATTNSGVTSNSIYSDGGRLDLWRVFVVANSNQDAAYGLWTDSDTTIDDSKFFVQGNDLGVAVITFGGQTTITDSQFQIQTSGPKGIGILTSSTSLNMARNVITASDADQAIGVQFSGGRLQDRHSSMNVSGTDRSRAIVVSDCGAAAATLIGTEIRTEAAPSRTQGIHVTNCPQFEASQIRIEATGSNANALVLDETGFTLAQSRINSSNNVMTVAYSIGDTNSYPVRVTHSRLRAPNLLLVELGPYDDTAVALSQLENGNVSGTVTCVNNVDGNLNDLGNTCP